MHFGRVLNLLQGANQQWNGKYFSDLFAGKIKIDWYAFQKY